MIVESSIQHTEYILQFRGICVILIYINKGENAMLFDSHTHSVYSFDGHDSIDAMCEAAIRHGVDGFAVTDHYDVDGILAGFYPDYDAGAARRDIEAARKRFDGRVQLYRGIELGQPVLCADESKAFLAANSFDFVIASCHNLENVPDFYFINFEAMPEPLMLHLYRRMIQDLTRYASFPGIHTIAHVTYPLRYMARAGRSVSVEIFESELRTLFSVMKECDVALELNMKGIRAGEIAKETEEYIFRLYRDCGGELVTVGSDAHYANDIGGWIRDGYTMLQNIGFRFLRVPGENGITRIPIEIHEERGLLCRK